MRNQARVPARAVAFRTVGTTPRREQRKAAVARTVSASFTPSRFPGGACWTAPRGLFLGGSAAFTLLELLVVIAIIGLLAALTAPVLNNFKPNYTASATPQLMDAHSRGRQLAISQRTTVYMVFVPTNFWGDPAFSALPLPERVKAFKLLDKQFIGYNFVSLRSMGDQPGQPTVHYLDSWRALPDGAFIFPVKFLLNNQSFLM